MPPRLHRALSCSALAGLVLLGEYAHRLQAKTVAEMAAAGSKKTGHATPPGASRGPQLIPWVISFLSVVALIVVIVVVK